MKIEARVEAAIEILGNIFNSQKPADSIIHEYVRDRRYIGSGDRREITEMVYKILRNYWVYDSYLRESKEFKNIGDLRRARFYVLLYHALELGIDVNECMDLFSGEKYAPKPLDNVEKSIFSRLLQMTAENLSEAGKLGISQYSLDLLKETYPSNYVQVAQSMHGTAPVDLRVNTLKATREEVSQMLNREDINHTFTTYSPWGIRLNQRTPLAHHPVIKRGLVEIQDEGSQLVALVVDAAPSMAVWDYCAGAGGKTLAIAATMKNKGRIVATDTIEWRLKKAPERFRRAGVHNVECRLLDGESQKWVKRQAWKFDRVLVDVPCSGSGTWRRNPELCWRMDAQAISEIMAKQRDILERAAPLVKPGGCLVYVTCSVYGVENQGQIQEFLAAHPEFSLQPIDLGFYKGDYLQLTPQSHGTDGFFAAVMVRGAGADIRS